MWNKSKEIKGVSSGSSVVDLNAVLAQEKQNVALGIKPSKKLKDPLSKLNKGVSERAKKDQIEKEVEDKKSEYNEDKLKEKVKVYNRFMRGEIYDPNSGEDSECLVDFELKRAVHNFNSDDDDSDDGDVFGHLHHRDLEMKKRRDEWERQQREEIEERKKKEENIKLYNQLKEETKAGREKNKLHQKKRELAILRRKELIRQSEMKRLATASKIQSNEEGSHTKDQVPSEGQLNKLQLKKRKTEEID